MKCICATNIIQLYTRSWILAIHAQVVELRLKAGKAFQRHSPNAQQVGEYMLLNGLSTNIFTSSDTICYRCYKLHTAIMKSLQEHEELSDTEVLAQQFSTASLTTSVEVAINAAALHVAQAFLKQQALLLPNVAQVFLSRYSSPQHCLTPQNLHLEDSTINFSNRWLLCQLIIKLGPFLSHKCVHRKFSPKVWNSSLSKWSWFDYMLVLGTRPD